jgi:hypothetical protein
LDAFHHTNFGINFNTSYDEYVSCWFDSTEARLTVEDVKPEIGGYGVRPIDLKRMESGHWQANVKLPPGLTAGWHGARVRVKDSAPSDSREIAVDVPLGAPDLQITGIADGQTWKPKQIDLAKGASLAIWIQGLPKNADRNNVKVLLQGRRIPVNSVERETDPSQPRQVNVDVPDFAPAGMLEVVVEAGNRSPSELVEVLRP